MISLAIILLIILAIVSIIDIKTKSIPSVFLTGILFVVLALRMDNLAFGLLAGLLMLLVYDLDKKKTGMADFKVMMMIGLMISTIQGFFTFAIIFAIFQSIYIFSIKKIFKDIKEIPFIPCLYAIYIALFFIGGVA